MLYDQIKKNKRKTILLILITVITFAILGSIIGELTMNSYLAGLIIAGIVGGFTMISFLFTGTKMVMRQNNAYEITENDAPQVWHMVQDMAMVAQLPMPRVFIIEDPTANAFAMGLSPKRASLAITTGLLNLMTRSEIEGVIGHEMTHIRNYDVRTMTIIAALSAAISTMLNYNIITRDPDDDSGFVGLLIRVVLMIIIGILASFIMLLLQSVVSRSQEYSADAGSAELTRNPKGLISALEKLETLEPTHVTTKGMAAMYFGPIDSQKWFNTHPDTQDRIEALKKL